ncbi:MAG: septation protein SepH [Nostocoides sp.]
MRDLRLVGVHEDGQHVLLSDGNGERYRLPLDDALRAAARRDRPHLGQLQIEIEGGLRPRDVQALLRSGLATAEVADRAGWTIEKVHRFEGPVLAEREYVAGLARNVALAGSSGDGPTLAARVATRLRERGVDPTHTVWDSARQEDGTWRVVAEFPAGGRERSAAWRFQIADRVLVPSNDEAKWLSGDDVPDGPIPAIGASTGDGPAGVYDVEADGGVNSASPRHAREPVDLVSAMRDVNARHRRRPRRTQPTLPVLADPEDEATVTPLEVEPDQPGASAPQSDAAGADTQPRSRDAHEGDGSHRRVAADQPTDVEDQHADEPTPITAGRRRNGRPSVPSWDDIMFGAKEPDHSS